MTHPRNVGILLFDDVEVLDFAGPFEVFSVTGRRGGGEPPFNVYTLAGKAGPVIARNGLAVVPHFTLEDCPPPEILVVPGGFGTRRELHNAPLIDWIAGQAARADLTLSVCTGALLLGKAGLLGGLHVTTHRAGLDLLRELVPDATVTWGERFIDNGAVITSGGISAGIDMALYVVARLLGDEVARETADYMEYDWRPDAP